MTTRPSPPLTRQPLALGTDAGGHYLRLLLDLDLTDQQLHVVTAPLAPQLVVAGAGSGKTTIMAARVVHAVAHHGIPPGEVLGLTFTNKAAGELADKVRRALALLVAGRGAQLVDPAVLDDQPTVATYHAYAGSLVADHALRIGREPDPTLLTEAGRWQLALGVVRRARGPFHHLDWSTPTVAQYLLDLDGELGEHLVGPAAVRAVDAVLRASVAAAARPTKEVQRIAASASSRDELLDLVEAYRARKRELDLVDFADQVALAAEVAAVPEVAETERGRHALVLLDEYQDTGVAQRALLTRLYSRGHAVTAVGDPCQSIYGWRGASVGNLLRFPQHFPRSTPEGPDDDGYAADELLVSWRNGGRILAAANTLSAALRTPRDGQRRPHVDVAELQPAPGREDAGLVRLALHPTAVDEAEWVADEVARLVGDGTVRPGGVAVLCRRRADFPLLHRALVARDLPAEVVGLGGLLAMPEVADVVAVLDLLVDPTANPSLVRVLTGPRHRLGPRDLAALGRRAGRLAAQAGGGRGGVDAADDPDGTLALAAATAAVDPCDVVALLDAVDSPGDARAYSPEALARLGVLRAELELLRPLAGHPVVEAVTTVIATVGLDVELEAAVDGTAPARRANLAAFLDHAARFSGPEGGDDLGAFLDYLAAARVKEDGLDVGAVSEADTVKLLTAHKAKGLEWDVVAVPTISGDNFPAKLGRSRWTSAARVLPYRLRGDRDDLPADPEPTSKGLAAFADACRADDLDEERRLAYVALTRARHLALVSGHVWREGRQSPCPSSVFLCELRDAPGVEVVSWCEEPGAEHPLAAAAGADVAWPVPPDPDALAARRRAADLVRVAAGLPDEVLDDPARPVPGEVAQLRWETDKLLEELAREDDADLLVPLPRSLTASQLMLAARDPGALASALARPLPRRPSAAARRGTRFHAWVEAQYGVRPLLTPDDLPGAGDASPGVAAELEALQAAFLAGPYAARTPHAVEAPFVLPLGGRLVRGRIDAVYDLGGGRWEVVDWKTGREEADPLQLAVYRLAWAREAGCAPDAVDAVFLTVATGEVVRPELADEDTLVALLGGGTAPPVGPVSAVPPVPVPTPPVAAPLVAVAVPEPPVGVPAPVAPVAVPELPVAPVAVPAPEPTLAPVATDDQEQLSLFGD